MSEKKDLKHLAKLARLELTDEEEQLFAGQMENVLEYMELLQEVDTEGVEGTSQVTGLVNVLGEDQLEENPEATREELLACSELPKESAQIRVKKTI